ncbi:uncharacterized protein AB675_9444 [Cyphellophora attinorum]|uniref:Small ribosomal subunit protein uS7 domain-containing protein n=1 Tax=Cyphellophora attinorum TaxID=1664694 RepID=A0A0N1HKE7_9EURO|nr:uncharacterized protein AB675_9444 [Phialophora attinorum]KPI34703.1 hypothetical protein AB675_9444 [Phialophora attinorum]
MPPRLPLRLPIRTATSQTIPRKLLPVAARAQSSKSDAEKAEGPGLGRMQEKAAETPHGANESQLPHVTEEQAAMDKIMGEPASPQAEDHGSPIQDILKRDKDAQKNAPEVLKKDLGKGQARSYSTAARRTQTRAYSTTARRLQTEQTESSASSAAADRQAMIQAFTTPAKFEETRAVGLQYPDAGPGHKFPLPDTENFPITNHLRRRYDPVVDQFTKMIMRDGKLARAQKNMSLILDHLRTSPLATSTTTSATGAANRPLLSDNAISTTRITRPSIPRPLLTSAIDSVAPLIKIQQRAGILGGGQNLPIPIPLRVKQRRRTAIKWILESSKKRSEVALWERVAKEVVAVVQGQSGVWEKRGLVHRLGVGSRSNVRDRGAVGQRPRGARLPMT